MARVIHRLRGGPSEQVHRETERQLKEAHSRMDDVDASLRLLRKRLEVIQHR